MKILALFAVFFLMGCQGSPVYYHRDPARQIVVLEKREISIITLGENRWEAYGGKEGGMKPDLEVQKARQVAAIEKVTGCRVVNAQVVPGHEIDGMLMHATVSCTK
ncbi:MAG: hypothetical protein CK528_09840 [Alcaligenaceae bacterium]|nr:MAG: hypothetical protein CK528_09840 [Alcaligenaceae bacterium]